MLLRKKDIECPSFKQDKTVTAVAAAKRHTVVLTERGEVWTWGHKQVNAVKVNLNNSVDLRQTPGGDGPTLRFHRGHRDVLRPVAVAIAAGAAHSSVLTATGSVLTWTSWEPASPATLVGGALSWRKVSAIAAGAHDARGGHGWRGLCMHYVYEGFACIMCMRK